MVSEVALKLKLDKSTTSRRVRKAIAKGFLRNLETKRGKPSRLVIGESLPEDIEILPSVERLRSCTDDKGDIQAPPSSESPRDQSTEDRIEVAI